jgi:hypothetical protein
VTAGVWGAAAFSVVAFAMAHTFQGVKGILGSGLIGSLPTLIVLISGSLLPAVALHALIDIGHGLIAWLVFRRTSEEGDMVTG